MRAMLAWLIMAALFGLAGFLIVYYYATYERPSEHFAIVIDAGSTQTRSSLYRVSVHTPELLDWTRRVTDDNDSDKDGGEDQDYAAWPDSDKFQFPLGNFIQVRQVSSCVNGGPLASISSPLEARNLIKSCLIKFARHIKLLDFVEIETGSTAAAAAATSGSDDNIVPDADEVSRQLALTNHRVNSVTHLHLGATAGMRALEELNRTRAEEKLSWIDDAIGRSNELLAPGDPYVNKGFVGIIQGSDEASFGWLSVNFVCNTLSVHLPATIEPTLLVASQSQSNPATNDTTVYQLSRLDGTTDEGHTGDDKLLPVAGETGVASSVGTLELGGASAQMALQVASNKLGSFKINSMSLDEQNLSLFNGQYRLGTRSDLCLGMSQAVLRLNYVLLHSLLAASTSDTNQAPPITSGQSGELNPFNQTEFANPCLQTGARLELSANSLAQQWHGACLAPNSHNLEPNLATVDGQFRAKMMRLNRPVVLVGTGNVEQCDILLDNLVDPKRCKRHFSLCPTNNNQQSPPEDMQFVTISGYNHALNVLGLTAKLDQAKHLDQHQQQQQQQIDETIDEKLGGSSIDYGEFIQKTREFCSTNLDQLMSKYPKVNKAYRNIICLQLIYIKKLLIEFYRFDPLTSWSQIKFLIFTPKSVPNQFATVQQVGAAAANKHNKLDIRRDIGWTLGLILNATSYQIESDDPNQIYFHHGASVMFIIRTTIVLMLACCFVAIALLIIGIFEVRHAQDRGDAYISHSSCSSSSYDVSDLGSSIVAKSSNGSKKPVQRYVLNP